MNNASNVKCFYLDFQDVYQVRQSQKLLTKKFEIFSCGQIIQNSKYFYRNYFYIIRSLQKYTVYINIQQIVLKLIILDDIWQLCSITLHNHHPSSMHFFHSVKCCGSSEFCFRAYIPQQKSSFVRFLLSQTQIRI